jgi:hypothetical protein
MGPLLPERTELTEVTVEFVVGVLPDAARVEDDDVGLGHIGGRLEPVRHEQPGEALGVVLVHLAPEGTDEELLGHGSRIVQTASAVTGRRPGGATRR